MPGLYQIAASIASFDNDFPRWYHQTLVALGRSLPLQICQSVREGLWLPNLALIDRLLHCTFATCSTKTTTRPSCYASAVYPSHAPNSLTRAYGPLIFLSPLAFVFVIFACLLPYSKRNHILAVVACRQLLQHERHSTTSGRRPSSWPSRADGALHRPFQRGYSAESCPPGRACHRVLHTGHGLYWLEAMGEATQEGVASVWRLCDSYCRPFRRGISCHLLAGYVDTCREFPGVSFID